MQLKRPCQRWFCYRFSGKHFMIWCIILRVQIIIVKIWYIFKIHDQCCRYRSKLFAPWHNPIRIVVVHDLVCIWFGSIILKCNQNRQQNIILLYAKCTSNIDVVLIMTSSWACSQMSIQLLSGTLCLSVQYICKYVYIHAFIWYSNITKFQYGFLD